MEITKQLTKLPLFNVNTANKFQIFITFPNKRQLLKIQTKESWKSQNNPIESETFLSKTQDNYNELSN